MAKFQVGDIVERVRDFTSAKAYGEPGVYYMLSSVSIKDVNSKFTLLSGEDYALYGTEVNGTKTLNGADPSKFELVTIKTNYNPEQEPYDEGDI